MGTASDDRSASYWGAEDQDGHKKKSRLVVVSNRVADLSAGHQSGGLAVAVGEALVASGGVWFGWNGETAADAREQDPTIQRFGEVCSATVPLTPEEHEGFYLGYANRCLWPLFHYRLDLADLKTGAEVAYFAVNERFAKAVARLLKPDDTVWVHDYQLVPLGAALRRNRVTNPIGFFLHIPFPSPEIFAALPDHADFAQTLFSYDLVGFQTMRDRENFARYSEEFLEGRRLHDRRLKAFGRTLAIDAFPIGIDAESFAEEAEKNARAPQLRKLLRESEDQALIVGVDRLDYSKGLPERLRGIEAFLETSAQYRGRIRHIQIAPPTREGVDAYDAIRAELEELTGHVNGRFGDLAWQPVSYIHRALPRPLLAGLYRRSRVGLVTPLRDGMNLVAKEYVAAQDPENPGVLVLSQFAGAAEQFEHAVLINPHDPASIAAGLQQALEMPLGERRARHQALWRITAEQDVGWWRERFLHALAAAAHSRLQNESASPRKPALSEAIPHDPKPDPAKL